MQWSQLQDLNKVRQSLWLTFPINKNHSFLLTNYSWSYHPQILGKFVRSSKWRTWGKSLIYTTFSAPYGPDSLWQCIAALHLNINTPPHTFTHHRHKQISREACATPHWLSSWEHTSLSSSPAPEIRSFLLKAIVSAGWPTPENWYKFQ